MVRQTMVKRPLAHVHSPRDKWDRISAKSRAPRWSVVAGRRRCRAEFPQGGAPATFYGLWGILCALLSPQGPSGAVYGRLTWFQSFVGIASSDLARVGLVR